MTIKSLVACCSFVFFLLFGLMISTSSYKSLGLFWTDMFGIFLMPSLTAFSGACFIYTLLFWYEVTRYGGAKKVVQDS